MDSETRTRLDAIPIAVFINWLSDSVSDSIAMCQSSFMLAMQFRNVQPEELLAYSLDRVRAVAIEKILARKGGNP